MDTNKNIFVLIKTRLRLTLALAAYEDGKKREEKEDPRREM